MAKLYINKDIVADKDKMMNWYLTGDDGMSFSDVQAFMDWMMPEDNNVDVEIHSCGGDCVEGYAIYDALRTSGKEISCKVVGDCASMATVLLLAAPIERRTMYEHARMLIHNPYYPAVQGAMTAEKLQSLAAELTAEKTKMLNLYVERTGKTAEELEAQMNTNAWFDVNRAIELGFVSSVVPAISAKVDKQNINPKKETMAKEVKVASSLLDRLLAKCGYARIEDVPAVAMVLTTVTGEELNVEREEGEIQVGDPASPDGEHVLEDGRTVVVQDGIITEIREVEVETQEDVEALKARIAELEAENADLKKDAKTDEEVETLAFVSKAGGVEKLKKLASTYVPAGRKANASTDKKSENKPVSMISERLKQIENERKGGKK